MSAALLIVDEVGFQPLARLEAGMGFRLVCCRCQRGSMILTIGMPVNDWPEILAGDEAMTTTLLDPLRRRSRLLDIRGRSHRLRDLEKSIESPRRSGERG